MARTDQSAVRPSKLLNVAGDAADDQKMPHLPSADPTQSAWTVFVDRYGVTASAGLLAVIPSLATAVADPAGLPESLPALRLGALLIAVAAMAVLVFREAPTPAAIPVIVDP